MVEKFQRNWVILQQMRWTALVLLATAMFLGIYSSISCRCWWTLLQNAARLGSCILRPLCRFRTIPQCIRVLPHLAGIILDKMGVRFTAILPGAVMVLGAAINWYAVTDSLGQALSRLSWTVSSIFRMHGGTSHRGSKVCPASAKFAAIGFMIFGCGTEMAGITVSRGIVKWFTGREMALAMGVEMAIARVGVAVVMLASPAIAAIAPISVSRPVACASAVALHRFDMLHHLRFHG